jgi:hypothetical protein
MEADMAIISKPPINKGTGLLEHKTSAPTGGPSSTALGRIMSLMASTQVERVATKDVRINPKNAKRHPKKQVALIAENMRAFGFANPLLIDEDNNIIAGHGRYAAALQLGLPEVLPSGSLI